MFRLLDAQHPAVRRGIGVGPLPICVRQRHAALLVCVPGIGGTGLAGAQGERGVLGAANLGDVDAR